MTPLKKAIDRLLTLKVSGLPEREWVIRISPGGLVVRRKNYGDEYRATWYQLIGFLIVHGKHNRGNGNG